MMLLWLVLGLLWLLLYFRIRHLPEPIRQIAPQALINVMLEPLRFEDFRYQMLWLQVPSSGLALGINVGNFKDSNFGTRIHEAMLGPAEFSCFPDDVVYAVGEKGIQMAYAPYLRWNSSAGNMADGRGVFSMYEHSLQDGYSEYIEDQVLSSMDALPAEIRVRHELPFRHPFVKTTVEITNTSSEVLDFFWVYQDGAFLYLPDQSQADASPMTQASFGRFGTEAGSPMNWVGLVNEKRGILSAIFAPTGEALFALPRYLGIDCFPVSSCMSSGYDCIKGGNDRCVRSSEKGPLDILTDLSKDSRDATPADMKVMGVVLHVGKLPAGGKRSAEFFRIGLTGLQGQNAETIRLKFSEIVSGIAAF